MRWIDALTNFGDLAVLAPLAALLLVWLFFRQPKITALWWIAAVALCIGATAALKIYLYLCPPLPDLQSPSGHTGLGTLVYGALTTIVAAESRSLRRTLVAAAGAIFILAIAWSRIAVDAHTGLEVIVGLGIGAASLGLFAERYSHRYRRGVAVGWLLAIAAVLAILLHGQEVNAEAFLQSIGIRLHTLGMVCF